MKKEKKHQGINNNNISSPPTTTNNLNLDFEGQKMRVVEGKMAKQPVIPQLNSKRKRVKSQDGLQIVHDDYTRKVVDNDELNHNDKHSANKEIQTKRQRFEEDVYKKLKVHVKRSNNPAKQPILQIHGYESIGKITPVFLDPTSNKTDEKTGALTAHKYQLKIRPFKEKKENVSHNVKDPLLSLNSLREDVSLNWGDFDIVAVLGKGGFGKVYLAKTVEKPGDDRNKLDLLQSHKYVAIKTMYKKRICESYRERKHMFAERRALEQVRGQHPFILYLLGAFQSSGRFCLVTEYCHGGELFQRLSEKGKLSEKEAKFYMIEMALALNFLHGAQIIFRDLKPENIMIGDDGHIKLIDFGLVRDAMYQDDYAQNADGRLQVKMTFCGTQEYMAPEVFNHKSYNYTADWWSYGAVSFDMIAGRYAFKPGKYDLPIDWPPATTQKCMKLLTGFLTVDSTKRLGSSSVGGFEKIKSETFFKDIDWVSAEKKGLKPPFIPNQSSDPTDLKHFDPSQAKREKKISKIEVNPQQDMHFFGFDWP